MSISEPEQELLQITEALLTASPEPLTQAVFAQSLQQEDVALDQVIETLQQIFKTQHRPVRIVPVAGGYQLVTKSEFHPYLRRMFQRTSRIQLSKAALETLAIIAYRQPVTKTEIDQIRGVNSDTVIKNLLERELITIKGRDEGVGRPLLYGTTREFLQAFGLADLSSLPMLKEIDEILGDDKHPTQANDQTE